MINRTVPTAVLLFLLITGLIGGGFYFYQASEDFAVGVNDDASSMTASIATPVADIPGDDVQATYTNDTYGYSLTYPANWFVSEDRKIIDTVNNIYSIIYFSKREGGRDVMVSVSGNEWKLKDKAPSTKDVTIDGNTETAYIFPEGYDCTGGAAECSFYTIPMKNGDMWIDIGAFGNIDPDLNDEQFKILSTFTLN